MAIRYRHLDEDGFAQAHATMVAAFADYQLDMSYMTAERSWLRNLKSGVQYDCSVAAFDGDRMVGFTFVGLDQWRGEPAAFDAGTGIIPGYRGQGVASVLLKALMAELRLPDGTDSVKINNIDRSDETMLGLVEKAGADWVIDQYEMEYRF